MLGNVLKLCIECFIGSVSKILSYVHSNLKIKIYSALVLGMGVISTLLGCLKLLLCNETPRTFSN